MAIHEVGLQSALIPAFEYCVSAFGQDSSYTKGKLADLCHELIAETDAHPPSLSDDQFDPGFFLSFWTYPKVEALAYVIFQLVFPLRH